MPEKEIDTTTTAAQDLVHWDPSRLESRLPKSKAAKNVMEPMYQQIAFKQAKMMSEDIACSSSTATRSFESLRRYL